MYTKTVFKCGKTEFIFWGILWKQKMAPFDQKENMWNNNNY